MYNIHTKEDHHRHLQAGRQIRRGGAEAAQSLHARLAGQQRDQHGPGSDRPDLDPAQAARLATCRSISFAATAPPQTNESLRRKGGGQAKRSQHILGKAADISFPDVPVKSSAQFRARAGTWRRRLLPDLGHSLRPCRYRQCAHVAAHSAARARGALPQRQHQISADRRQADHPGRLQARLGQGHGQQDHGRFGDAGRQGQVADAPDTDVVRRGRERRRGRSRRAAAGARFGMPRPRSPTILTSRARLLPERLFTYASAGGMSLPLPLAHRPPQADSCARCPPIRTPRSLARPRPTTTIPTS